MLKFNDRFIITSIFALLIIIFPFRWAFEEYRFLKGDYISLNKHLAIEEEFLKNAGKNIAILREEQKNNNEERWIQSEIEQNLGIKNSLSHKVMILKHRSNTFLCYVVFFLFYMILTLFILVYNVYHSLKTNITYGKTILFSLSTWIGLILFKDVYRLEIQSSFFDFMNHPNSKNEELFMTIIGLGLLIRLANMITFNSDRLKTSFGYFLHILLVIYTLVEFFCIVGIAESHTPVMVL